MANKHARRRQSPHPWLWIGAIALIVIAAGVWFVTANAKPPTQNANALDVAAGLPNTDTAFSIGTRVGQRAPAFTLLDAQSQLYAFQPGDGRKYMLAFNMGYV